jgi:ubiquitin-conjugating enzyme E2 J1
MYHGRITLPTTYPLKPPNFRFLTPSGRFETNREICLSISGFHEETWMPAWGVRTALTALRSFMAEKGSAGQVGGLEASKEVRERLAKESRGWRCEACGKANEVVMREWWDICREAGVDLKTEEDIKLEDLPEGMALEARDPNAKGKGKDTEEPAPTTAAVSESQPQPSIPNTLQPPIQPPARFVATPTAEATQASAESYLSPSELAAINNNTLPRPITNLHSAPLAAANASLSQSNTQQSLSPSHHHTSSRTQTAGQPHDRQATRRETPPTITIDRAIAGVFVALCLMLLKKIFFPGGKATGGWNGGSMDDFYLQRE